MKWPGKSIAARQTPPPDMPGLDITGMWIDDVKVADAARAFINWGHRVKASAPDRVYFAEQARLLNAAARTPLSFTFKIDDADMPGLRAFIDKVWADSVAVDRWADDGGAI